ncbi:MAG: MFS transporter [Sterolibacterium sp.]
MMVEVLSSLEISMVFTAFPTIQREFNDPHMTGWLLTSFLLVQAGTAAVGGRLGDIFGRKRLLTIIIAICILGSFVSAVAPNLELIILGRAAQGVSGAILPLCYGITRQVTTPKSAPFYIGCLTGAYAFAAAMGYIVAGYLTDMGSWRFIFWFTVIYGVTVLPLLLLVVPECRNPPTSKHLDIVGGLLFMPAIACLLYGVMLVGKLGWHAADTLVFLSLGSAILVYWFWHEARHEDPLIDVSLMREPKIAMGNVCIFLVGMGGSQIGLISMLILQQPAATGVGFGVTATLAGILKLPANIATALSAALSGWIAGKYGAHRAVLQGAVIGTLAWGFLIFFHASLWLTMLGIIVAAFSVGMLLAALPNMILEASPLERSSETTGLAAVLRGIGITMGAQILTTILAGSRVSLPGSNANFASETAYWLCFGYIALTVVVIVLLSLFINPQRLNGSK